LFPVLLSLLLVRVASADEPLPSWNDGPAKQAIVDFVKRATTPDSPEFVPEPERIATFDDDGTLLAEQPLYFQVIFALDRVRAHAPEHPEWKEKEPFKSILAGDTKAVFEGDERAIERALVELVMATHAGMTPSEFEKIVKDWLATAKHPRFGQPFTQCVYQPMLELFAYLRANGFKTYPARGCACSCTTATPSANGPTTGIRKSAGWTRRLTPPRRSAGRS
jgi:hypothetical protein